MNNTYPIDKNAASGKAPGRPNNKTPTRRHAGTEQYKKRELLKAKTLVKKIDAEIESLQASVRGDEGAPKLNNARVSAARVILTAQLAMLAKVAPDLKSVEHTGSVGHDHQHTHREEPVSDIELAHRLMLTYAEKKPMLEKLTGRKISLRDMAAAMHPPSPITQAKTIVGEIIDTVPAGEARVDAADQQEVMDFI